MGKERGMPFQMRTVFEVPCPVVSIMGDVDLTSASQFADELDDVLDAGDEHVVLTFHGVTMIDSRGLQVLLDATDRPDHFYGRLIIAGARPHVMRACELAGLGDRLVMHAHTKLAILEAVRATRDRPRPAAAT